MPPYELEAPIDKRQGASEWALGGKCSYFSDPGRVVVPKGAVYFAAREFRKVDDDAKVLFRVRRQFDDPKELKIKNICQELRRLPEFVSDAVVDFVNDETDNSQIQTESEWAKPLFQSLSELLMLSKNWDSYGANRIDPSLVSNSITLLLLIIDKDVPRPSVVPTSDGGIQLEWHTRGIDMEISVELKDKFNLFFKDRVGGNLIDQEVKLSNPKLFLDSISTIASRS